MARGYEPEGFIAPREVSEKAERDGHLTTGPNESRQQVQPQDLQEPGSLAGPDQSRSADTRKVYEIRGRTYRLRSSEIVTMAEIGKFRAIAVEDLREFRYSMDKNRLRLDVESLVRQGLLQMKSIPHEEKGSRQLLSLTKAGHRLLTGHGFAGKDQALYFGFAKPREAHHDADLYRLYQKAASKIERAGGRNLRVILDYELKKRVYHDLANLGSDRTSPESKRTVAERHDLQIVRGKIPLPDVRIEYDTPDGERARVDIELATSHYRGRSLAEKVRAGFAIYAHAQDVSNLRRVLDQRELTAEILSL
jgi:hypothetical protein